MTNKININWAGMGSFHGEYQINDHSDARGHWKSHTITIEKTEEAKAAFSAWPSSQGMYFDCTPVGSGDYFLIDKDSDSYVFSNK